MKTYFAAIVHSGSTCMCRVRRNISVNCGHKHITESAAEKCLHKLRGWSKDGKSCCATWYNGTVVELDKKHNEEVYIDENGDAKSTFDACTC